MLDSASLITLRRRKVTPDIHVLDFNTGGRIFSAWSRRQAFRGFSKSLRVMLSPS